MQGSVQAQPTPGTQGNIIRLSAGDLVPADARLLEAVDLHAQQAALTGESLPCWSRSSSVG